MFEALGTYWATIRLFVVGQPVLFVITSGILIAAFSVAGEVAIYWAARLGGPPLIVRMAARGWLRMDSQRVQRTEALFSRWGVYLVMFGRILPGVRTLASVPAGLSRMNFGVFLGAAFTGASVWNTVLVALGYTLGFNVTPLGISLLG